MLGFRVVGLRGLEQCNSRLRCVASRCFVRARRNEKLRHETPNSLQYTLRRVGTFLRFLCHSLPIGSKVITFWDYLLGS